jgi:putative ATP-dependent endonuclease of the OLD family
MRISRIHIQNFRSIRDAEIQPTAFSLLVGKNNHGKTNFFEAISWFYSGKGDTSEIRFAGVDAVENSEVVVEIEFAEVLTGVLNISNDDNRQKIKNVIGDRDSMRVRRTSADPKNRYIYHQDSSQWKKQPAGADPAFNNCIPRFEFVLTSKNLKEVSAYKSTTPIGQMLGGVIADALELDSTYQDFLRKFDEVFTSPDSSVRRILQDTSNQVKEHLKLQFPDCRMVDFRVDVPSFDEFLKSYTTTLDDGVLTDAVSKGDGMQRALMLAIIKAHADMRRDESLGRAFIFFIDEAELHLHPTAQRQLKNALLSLAEGVDQVFVTSHSSVFLSEEAPQQTSFLIEKENGATSAEVLTKNHRKRAVFELLGGSPADLLLPANLLIVEGPSEVEFLNRVIERFCSEMPSIQVLAARGDDQCQADYLKNIMKIFSVVGTSPIYKDRAILLLDSPKGEDKEKRLGQFLRNHSYLERNDQVFVLPVETLEEYYPEQVRSEFSHVSKKVKLAKKIGSFISMQDFEDHMAVVHQALMTCAEKAYGNS